MTLTRSRSRSLALLTISAGLTLAGLSGGAALAQGQPSSQQPAPGNGLPGEAPGSWANRGPSLTPEQRKQIFPAWRTLALQNVQGRIGILQTQQRCIASSTDLDGLKGCMRQERQAMQAHRQQHREAMQQLFERNNLPAPQWLFRPLRPLEQSQTAPGSRLRPLAPDPAAPALPL